MIVTRDLAGWVFVLPRRGSLPSFGGPFPPPWLCRPHHGVDILYRRACRVGTGGYSIGVSAGSCAAPLPSMSPRGSQSLSRRCGSHPSRVGWSRGFPCRLRSTVADARVSLVLAACPSCPLEPLRLARLPRLAGDPLPAHDPAHDPRKIPPRSAPKPAPILA